MKQLLTLAAALAVFAGAARAQVVFNQTFSTDAILTPPGANSGIYLGTGANQFDTALPADGSGASWAVSNGVLTGSRSTASGSVNRTTNLPLAGSAASYELDFSLGAIASASSSTLNDFIFQVGSGYSSTSTGAESSHTYAQFTINLLSTTQYSVGGVTFSGASHFYLALNNTGSTQNFTTPGGPLSLPNDNFALYVTNNGTVTTLAGGGNNVSAVGGIDTNDITQFKLRFATDAGAVNIDNLMITQVPEPGSMAGLLAAAPALWLALRRKR